MSPTRQHQPPHPSPAHHHHHRHRSHTISKIACDSAVGGADSSAIVAAAAAAAAANHHSIVNRCGYDSFLHATICTNNVTGGGGGGGSSPVNNSPMRTHSHPTGGTPAKILQNYNNRAIRARHKSNEPMTVGGGGGANIFVTSASPQLQGYTKLNSSAPHHHHHRVSSKLNTSALSQLNPQLTPEQKFSRTINHVERWLSERDESAAATASTQPPPPPVLVKTNNTDQRLIKFAGVDAPVGKPKLRDIDKDEKNLDNLINTKMFADKLKMTEKFTEKFASSAESPPTKKTFNKELLLGVRRSGVAAAASSTPVKQRLSRSVVDAAAQAVSAVQAASASVTPASDSNRTSNKIMEFSSVPVQVDASECENLLRASCSEDSVPSCVDGSGGGGVGDGDDGSQSAVHRYVHEHIHHHYHHFENTASDIL